MAIDQFNAIAMFLLNDDLHVKILQQTFTVCWLHFTQLAGQLVTETVRHCTVFIIGGITIFPVEQFHFNTSEVDIVF